MSYSLQDLVLMSNDATCADDGVASLINDMVWCFVLPCHDNALLWLRCCGDERDEAQEDEEDGAEELHCCCLDAIPYICVV